MTRPRLSVTREIYGIIGKVPNAGKLQAEWNAYFKKNGMDAFMDRYPTTIDTLQERLSEMFHFDRRAYILGPELQQAIIPLLDEVDEEARENGRVCLVFNKGGVLRGLYKDEAS